MLMAPLEAMLCLISCSLKQMVAFSHKVMVFFMTAEGMIPGIDGSDQLNGKLQNFSCTHITKFLADNYCLHEMESGLLFMRLE